MVNKISVLSFICLAFWANLLTAAKLDVSDEEISAQESSFSSQVEFYKAFKAGISSYFNNSDDDESLIALIINKYPTREETEAELGRIFNDGRTILRLVEISDPMPPRGENIAENWIFSLEIAGYDHIFYAIVDRNGAHPTYNYGFN